MISYYVIGLLSGSSLDGTDISYCRFDVDTSNDHPLLSWEIIDAFTFPYSGSWHTRLKALPNGSAKELVLTDTELGHYYGKLIQAFLKKHSSYPCDLISSHGHTIFHFPQALTTTQIGDGAAILSECNINTVTQLRSVDLAYQGQGAPLAPLGDRFLFPGYDLYLNLGGISNITYIHNNTILAFDISTCNQLLNGLAQQLGKDYDKDGELASTGSLNTELLTLLQSDEYLSFSFPRSLDNTWCQQKHVIPTVAFDAPVADKLFTSVEFIAQEIVRSIQALGINDKASMFCTGGGALNLYLMKRLKFYAPDIDIHIPSKKEVEFKEASFIALAGLWRSLGIPNLYSSVTGASIDTINGAMYIKQNRP